MPDFVVEAEVRDTFGKNASRRLRMQGRIPGVVYGQGLETIPLSVDSRDVYRILHSESGQNTIFKLSVDGDSREVLVKDYQLEPVSGVMVHADFQAVVMDRTMVFEVPVEAVGTPLGVTEGGVLDLVLREVRVECLPRDVPDRIHVDVADLEIGDSIRVERLQLDTSKVTLISEPELVVLTVVPPHVEKEAEVVAEEEPVEEPEVIKKGKPEEEEGEGEGKGKGKGEEKPKTETKGETVKE